MQQLAAEEGEGDEDEGPGRGLSTCLFCGRFSVVDGEGCLYCEEDEEDSFSYEGWETYSEPDEEEEKTPSASPATFCGFKKSFLCNSSVPTPSARNSQDFSLSFVLPQKQQLTAEEAERNAEELLAEEERAKKKAEKKRLKKKRQKDRKRQEKRNQELEAKSQTRPADSSDWKQGAPPVDVANGLRPGPPGTEGSSSQGPPESLASPGCSTEEELEEELDLTSTFVSKARLKVSTKAPLHKAEKVEKGKTEKEKTAQPEQQEAPKPDPQKTPVEQSLVLADCGTETAKRGGYWEAVLLFTEAVKLNPREYRFFGNRSFCYEKLQCYPEALRDAQVALRLQPGWPKGLFRQGKALMGLKQYAEAARTFKELLQEDGFRGDAAAQLRRCHLHLLLQNSVAPCAASLPAWNGPAQGTQLPFPGGRPVASCSPPGGMPLAVPITRLKSAPVPPPSAVQTPVRECFAVWVGNLAPSVSQEALLRCFQPFGPIDSIRCLPRRFCAFVNYTRQEAAEAAYVALQGVEVEGRKIQLQLKHPVHATPPVTKGASAPQLPLKREQAPLHAALGFPQRNASRAEGDRGSFGPLPLRGAAAKNLQPL